MRLKNSVVPVTPPAAEPVTLDEVKAHLNLGEFADDDAYLTALIQVARQACEEQTERAFLPQTWEASGPVFAPLLTLPRGPVRSVSAIRYYDENNDERTVSSAEYFLTAGGDVLFVDRTCHPAFYARPDAIRVEYVAGMAESAGLLPAPLRQAMLLLIGTWYGQRESIGDGQVREVPHTVDFLLTPYKKFGC